MLRAAPFSSAVCVLVTISGSLTTVKAQTPDSTVKSLQTVVVSATRAGTEAERVPLHTTVIPRAAIMKSPAQTLDQLLRDVTGMNLPGAPYYTTDPTGHQTKMRGVTNSKVLMLVDGIPIHDPFYVTTQWFKVPLSSIDHIEVMRGGSSSLWGSGAVAGVVNIITRRPIDNSAQLDVNYQSLNTTNAAVSKNFVVGSDLAVRVSGDMLRTDGYQTTPAAFLASVPGKAASSAKNENAQLAAYYTPAGSFSAFGRVGYHQQNEDIGGYTYGTNLQKSPDGAFGITQLIGDKSRADVRAWGQYQHFDKSNGAGCYLASATNCNTTSTTSPLVQYANSHDDNPYRELGASAILSSERVTDVLSSVQLGADFRTVGGEDHATTYNRPTTTDVSSATINRTNFGRGTQRFIGTFAQLRVSPVDRLEATASLRYDVWSNVNGVAEMTKYTNGAAGAVAGGPIADSHQNSFNPSVSARLKLADGLSVRGAAYRSFRAPGLNNLYRSFSSTTSITIANPSLSPETLTGAELGADVRAGSVTLGATAFRYNTRSLIASYKITSAATAPAAVIAICGATLSNCPATVNLNTNGQNAVSRGLELVGSWRVTSAATVDLGYTYTDSHYTSATTGDPINAQLGAIPKHFGTAGVTWRILPRWDAYVGTRHNDAMFLDVNHTIPQSSYTLYNASTSVRVHDRFEVYGAVTNLTDVKYVDSGTTSAASETLGLGRALTSGVRVRF